MNNKILLIVFYFDFTMHTQDIAIVALMRQLYAPTAHALWHWLIYVNLTALNWSKTQFRNIISGFFVPEFGNDVEWHSKHLYTSKNVIKLF